MNTTSPTPGGLGVAFPPVGAKMCQVQTALQTALRLPQEANSWKRAPAYAHTDIWTHSKRAAIRTHLKPYAKCFEARTCSEYPRITLEVEGTPHAAHSATRQTVVVCLSKPAPTSLSRHLLHQVRANKNIQKLLGNLLLSTQNISRF